MCPENTNRPLSRWVVVITWIVALFVPLLLAVTLLRKTYFMRTQDGEEKLNHVHLLSGVADQSDKPLFLLEWDAFGSAYRVVAQKIRPFGIDGVEVSMLDTKRHDLLIGRYVYRFSYSLPDSDGSPTHLHWELVGARLHVGDTVGRSPSFEKAGLLSYEPDRDGGRDLPLWMNGMPSNSFTVLNGGECGAPANAGCLMISDAAADRITLERPSGAPQFTHLRSHDRVAVNSQDTLWIANLPYHLSPVNGSREFNFVLPDKYTDARGDYTRIRGDRSLLGPPGLNGTVDPESGEVIFDDVTQQFKEHHVDERRWDPESEDELQLLIDSGLLCLTYELGKNATIIPQVKWADLNSRSCVDPLGQGLVHTTQALDEKTLEIYEQHRVADSLVARTNELFEQATTAPPSDFPLEFEWWPVQTKSGLIKIPTRIWGVRMGTTGRSLVPEPSSQTDSDVPTEELVLRSRKGDETTLAYSQGGQRNYTDAGTTLGLGPLLGERGRIDGLDEISRKATKKDEKLALTIDPDLQAALWNALKTELNKTDQLGQHPDTYNQSSHYGITGIAMDTQTGDVLAALNWPSGLIWEDKDKLQQVEGRSSWGVPTNSLNGAMMRADKVGSVFKLLSMYAMADAGQLDGGIGQAGPSCGGSKGSPAYVAALFTHDGKVSNGRKPFEDAQNGPLPTGPTGLSGGLDDATASSCNSYFTLAATLLLDAAPPNLKFVENCPVDEKMRRTDQGKETSRGWLLCEHFVRAPEEARGEHVHWLLLPEGESLANRSRKPFLGSNGPGYFKSAIQAGIRFGYPSPTGALIHRASELSYESTPFRQDWMRDLPGAEQHVFVYPMMFSPLSYFGGGEEKFGEKTLKTTPAFSWREFAAQAIGENGQGSALSVATLYSAVGRKDGVIPAPRLVHSADAKPDPPVRVFDPRDLRLKRIREALQQPILRGTAQKEVGVFLSKNKIEQVDLSKKQAGGIYGKTGTFVLEFLEDSTPQEGAESVAESKAGCGIVTADGLLSAASADFHLLGTSACERNHLMVTGVQRYPASPLSAQEQTAMARQSSGPSQPKKETHTTFAVVMEPKQSGHPVVFALIVDMDEFGGHKLNARSLSEPMLQAIWDWMQ